MQRLRKQLRWVVRSHCVVVHDPGENHVDPVLGCSVVRVRFCVPKMRPQASCHAVAAASGSAVMAWQTLCDWCLVIV